MQLALGDVMSLATQFAGRSDYSTSEVSKLANLALTEVSSRLHYKPHEEMALSNVTGTGDERRISLPGDFDAALGLKFYSTTTDEDGINVLGTEYDLPIAHSSVIDSHSSTTGTPARYALFGDYIEVDPIPGSRGSFVLRYTAKQPVLILSSDTPDLDERWHPGWLWKTTELVNLARANTAGAQEAERKYINYMASTPNDRAQEQSAKHGMGLRVKRS
jgi:hypothetical protein